MSEHLTRKKNNANSNKTNNKGNQLSPKNVSPKRDNNERPQKARASRIQSILWDIKNIILEPKSVVLSFPSPPLLKTHASTMGSGNNNINNSGDGREKSGKSEYRIFCRKFKHSDGILDKTKISMIHEKEWEKNCIVLCPLTVIRTPK
ncbi:hypothetical protein AX774_g6723 [Zancudomyces culisetae]|uniref:Uncharacterized protein n=1 Tax=Zancudomyces culisetae TaxID=1213189 RepID=A0A1R1PFZ9_ZANCU|nr:hypothetical protein AX774_g6723 [Zancudomyces culisetae]|eukprot:OMH79858.1 hypothetical protein AX774_g6723 [Zancudomyces culisetae]